MKTPSSIKKQATGNDQKIIELLAITGGKKPGKYRQMLIDLFQSNNISNPKKLRQFLDLILDEIDKQKTMRGI